MDLGCWGVISDHVRDYCCQVEGLEHQHLDADFPTSETCLTGDKLKRRCSKVLFWQEQLNGKKVKCEWLCYLPLSKKLYCFVCKFLPLIMKKIMLASVGYGDWKHAPRDLARCESSNKRLPYFSNHRAHQTIRRSINKRLPNAFIFIHKVLRTIRRI